MPRGVHAGSSASRIRAPERRLPDPGPVDPAALGPAAARNGIELLGPPPTA
ncbi:MULTISPECIES: hypothetical protein [Micromonospora]|uniref:hypothetical protein n=1 Tax=Micromonospora TaxID=1873 RepID=UPI00159BDE04|nr:MULTISPECIES: hypothetical protein [Micromonospora]